MPLEIEVKYLDANHPALRKRLAQLGAVCLGRWFEANIVFDDSCRSLKAKGHLVRLRDKAGQSVLTFKRAVADALSVSAKIYEEIETEVSDATATREILAGLGLSPALCYEKFRETWKLLGCEVCLDTLPFGDFLEIEGDEPDIAACAAALKLPADKATSATYHDLNRAARKARGLTPDDSFVFDAAHKARLLSGCEAQ